MNEEKRKEGEELGEEELHPPARLLQRIGYRTTIKLTCERLRELEPQEAIKFLEEELRITERQREMAFWQLYYDAKYVRFARRQIERLRKKLKEVQEHVENHQNKRIRV